MTLQDLINYAEEHEFDPSEMTIKIQNSDTMELRDVYQDDDEVYVTDNFAHNAIDKEILAQEIRKQFPDIRVKLINLQDISSYTNMSFDGIKICCGSFYLISKIY